MKTYKCIMSDGKKYEHTQPSAGVAIMFALATFPGRTVARCYAGMTELEARLARLSGNRTAMEGTEDFDIPPHEPMREEDAAVFNKRHRAQDKTGLMFSEAEMRGTA
jgi:hypothetical protein